MKLPDLTQELYEHYAVMSAQTHEAHVMEYGKACIAAQKPIRMPKLTNVKGYRLHHTNGVDAYREGWNAAVRAMLKNVAPSSKGGAE